MTGAQPPAEVLDEQLRRRMAEAVAGGRALLGEPGDGEAGPHDLRAVAAALVERLDAEAPELDERAAQQVHDWQLLGMKRRAANRAEAFDRIDRAVGRLREITSAATMLRSAPAELVASSALNRVVVSVVHGRPATAEAACFRDDEAGARTALEALRTHPLVLEHPLIEVEVLRRRRATIVTQAQLHARGDAHMTSVMGWDGCLVAPVTVHGSVVAVLHTDRGPGQRLSVLQRDLLWAFATGLAQAYESADLRRRLLRAREQTRELLAWLDARSGELSDGTIELVPRTPAPLPPPDAHEPAAGARGRDEGLALTGLLTRRELEVLRLLAHGHANRRIADELVISGGTVKFHVNSILRKLHVANRAEAVARYYALRGSGQRGAAHDDG